MFSSKKHKDCISRSESGVYIVFLALLLTALMAMMALVMGLGFLATDASHHKNLANLAALSALESYLNGDPQLTAIARAQQARARANLVLNQNGLLGFPASSTMGNLALRWGMSTIGPPNSSLLTLLSYYNSDPDGSGPRDPCSGSYPCFQDPRNPASGLAPGDLSQLQSEVNAARISLVHRGIDLPFGQFVHQSKGDLSTSSIVAVAPKCISIVIDVSQSSVQDTHFPSPNINAVFDPLDPIYGDLRALDDAAPFAVAPRAQIRATLNDFLDPIRQANSMNWPNFCGTSPTDPADNQVNNNAVQNPRMDMRAYWCSIWSRDIPGFNDEDGNGVSNGTGFDSWARRYASLPTPWGQVWIDSDPNTRAEPLASFLDAGNLALRLIRQRLTNADQAGIIAFAGNIRYQWPNAGLSPTLDFLIQLTNYNNRQVIQSHNTNGSVVLTPGNHMNFIDAGMFPVSWSGPPGTWTASDGSDSNYVRAIRDAITQLSSCPANARKTILLFGDNVNNCHLLSAGPPATYSCAANAWSTYSTADLYIRDVLSNSLIQNNIALTSITRGQGIGQHIMNIKNPYTNKFYTYDEAAARFETSIFSGHSYHLVNGTWVLESNDSVAYSNFGQPGWIFGPPNARFGQLAMQTGGRMCPLMDICTPSTVNDATGCQSAADPTPAGCPACSNGCYQRDPNNTCGPCILREETRVENSPQTCSLTDQSIALQAAECASKTIGDDPFVFIK